MIAIRTGRAQRAICWMASTKIVSRTRYLDMKTARTIKTQASHRKLEYPPLHHSITPGFFSGRLSLLDDIAGVPACVLRRCRGCQFASWKYPHGPTSIARSEGRRRLRAEGWQTNDAGCAA